MKKKTGVVVKVYKRCVCIRTVKGEFIKVKLKNYTPNTGDIYTSIPIKYQNTAIISFLVLILIISTIYLGKNFYYKHTSAATVIIEIPPIINLKINRYDNVVQADSTYKSGRKILGNINIKNNSINTALKSIIQESKNNKIINEDYQKYGKSVIIYISNSDDKNINLDEFIRFMNKNKIKLKINSNGTAPLLK